MAMMRGRAGDDDIRTLSFVRRRALQKDGNQLASESRNAGRSRANAGRSETAGLTVSGPASRTARAAAASAAALSRRARLRSMSFSKATQGPPGRTDMLGSRETL